MKKTVLFLFLLASISSFSQSTSELAGAWKFNALAEKSGVKASEKDMFLMLLKDLAFSFNEDKTYSKTMLGEQTAGTYEIKPGKLILTSETGSQTTHKIILFEKDRITIKHGEVNIVLTRV